MYAELTCHQELVHLDHEQPLVPERHRLAAFVVLRGHEDSHEAHALGVRRILDLDDVHVWGVLEMGESGGGKNSFELIEFDGLKN